MSIEIIVRKKLQLEKYNTINSFWDVAPYTLVEVYRRIMINISIEIIVRKKLQLEKYNTIYSIWDVVPCSLVQVYRRFRGVC
jgi:hypothetical protein